MNFGIASHLQAFKHFFSSFIPILLRTYNMQNLNIPKTGTLKRTSKPRDSLLEKMRMKKPVRSEMQNFNNCHNRKQMWETWNCIWKNDCFFLFKGKLRLLFYSPMTGRKDVEPNKHPRLNLCCSLHYAFPFQSLTIE